MSTFFEQLNFKNLYFTKKKEKIFFYGNFSIDKRKLYTHTNMICMHASVKR